MFSWLSSLIKCNGLLNTDENTPIRSSKKMPAAVRGAVMFAAREEGGKTEEEATVYVMALEKSGRLIEESWG
jgi:hypothetical protein